MSASKVVAGFVSFTEVTRPDEHRAYNEWHLFDHLPEQLPLRGVAWGQRWVLTPAQRALAVAEPPLDRFHYMTLYLLAGPLAESVASLNELAVELWGANRFHRHRHAHLSGPFELQSLWAAPRVLVSPEAVPYRPSRGVHVSVTTAPVDVTAEAPGVAGTWSFSDGSRWLTVSWLDGAVAPRPAPPDAVFSGALAQIDPWAPFDWFD